MRGSALKSENDDGDSCDCSGSHDSGRSSSGDGAWKGAGGEVHVIDFEWRNAFDWSRGRAMKALKFGGRILMEVSRKGWLMARARVWNLLDGLLILGKVKWAFA